MPMVAFCRRKSLRDYLVRAKHFVKTVRAIREQCTVIVADVMFAATLFPVIVSRAILPSEAIL